MKIYIVGSVASGKTTLSEKLFKKTGIKCCHLDNIVHKKDPSNKECGNIRRSDEEINKMFMNIIEQQDWIIEDAGRKIFAEGMEKADLIVHLKPSLFIRRKRIITRYINQKLGIEKCIYKPSINMVKWMFGILYNYETGKDDLVKRLACYHNKVIIIRNNKEKKKFIESISLSHLH